MDVAAICADRKHISSIEYVVLASDNESAWHGGRSCVKLPQNLRWGIDMEIAFLTGLVAIFMAWRAGARVKALEREVAALRLELFPQHSGVPEQQAGIRPDPDLTGATDPEPAAETPPDTPPAIPPTAEV